MLLQFNIIPIMKLLLYDPEYISHSIDVFRRLLTPELAGRVDQLVWVSPKRRHPEFRQWVSASDNVTLVDVQLGLCHPLRWLSAFVRRLTLGLHVENIPIGNAINHWLVNMHLFEVTRSHHADVVFCLAFMNQPVPRSNAVTSGILCDLSPDLPEASLANIDYWIARCSVIFCISEFTKSELNIRCRHQHDLVVEVVPPSPQMKLADHLISHQYSSELPEERVFDQNQLKCFIPASLQERKGHRVLLESAISALAQDVSLSLTFVGSGSELLLGSQACSIPFLNDLRHLLHSFQAKGGSCQALGHVDDCQFSELLECSDVVVFPSLFEGFGLPVSEAVMAGFPVIASDLPPIREQLDLFNCHHRVHLVPPGDSNLLASALVEFANGGGPSRVPPDDLSGNFKQWSWGMAAESIISHLETVTA
jgi:glycosyltransferase involved in cell wall biosynthesis